MDQASTASGVIYRVKWKGYDPTWEPYEHVRDCAALEVWQRQQQQQPSQSATVVEGQKKCHPSYRQTTQRHVPQACPKERIEIGRKDAA